MEEVKEIIVVCDPSYRDIFEGFFSLDNTLTALFLEKFLFDVRPLHK
jgi:hypothetical protein